MSQHTIFFNQITGTNDADQDLDIYASSHPGVASIAPAAEDDNGEFEQAARQAITDALKPGSTITAVADDPDGLVFTVDVPA